MVIMKSLFCLFESFWRRWFGGGFDSKKYPILNERYIQHICGALVMFLSLFLFCDFDKMKFLNWLIPNFVENHFQFWATIYITIIIEGLYWSRSHGPAFDMSRGGKPGKKMIERYKKEWWNKICEFFVPENQWYGFGYDLLWMGFRYTCPLVLLTPIFGWNILMLGVLVTLIYGFCWSFYEKCPKIFENKYLNKLYIEGPTELAEYIVGFVSGYFLMFC